MPTTARSADARTTARGHDPANTAAWLPAQHAALELREAPYTPPADDQIVIRARAVAVNPLDWIIQVAAKLVYRWLSFPTVLGSDVAGEVVEIGANVTRFRLGDRVLGHAVGTDRDVNSAAEGAFQQYTVVLERLAAPIPDTMDYAHAAVLPLATSTAACGLFQDDFLALKRPTQDPAPTGETVLVWGGASSAGSQAIQLAHAAGYDVITTCSPRNFAYVTALGADLAFDYNAPTVIDDITIALHNRTFAGAIAFGTTSADACVRIAGTTTGTRFVALATPPVSFAGLAKDEDGRSENGITRRLISSNIALQVAARRRHVKIKYIFGTSLKHNDISHLIYRDYLPAALADGRYHAVPAPRIVGDGLEHLQRAIDLQRAGVSAEKIVITIPDTPTL